MDDDFDDFGVFEEAEPVEPSLAAQPSNAFVTATTTHWPYLDSQASQIPQRPDLLKAQDTFPRCLETPGGYDPVDLYLGEDNYPGSGLVGADSITANLDLDDIDDKDQGRLHQSDSDLVDRILDGTLNSPTQRCTSNQSHDQPEVNLPNVCPSQESFLQTEPSVSDLPVGAIASTSSPCTDTEQRKPSLSENGSNVSSDKSRNNAVCDKSIGHHPDENRLHDSNNSEVPTEMGSTNDPELSEIIDETVHGGVTSVNVDTRDAVAASRGKGSEMARVIEADLGQGALGHEVTGGYDDWSSKEISALDWLVKDAIKEDLAFADSSSKSSIKMRTPRPVTMFEDAQRDLQEKFEKELEEVKRCNTETEELLRECQEELRVQRGRYTQLQEKHAADLCSMRESGHAAMAILIEQHEETMKLALLQQQEVYEKRINETLSVILRDTQTTLSKQREELSLRMEERLHEQNESWERRFADNLSTVKAEENRERERLVQTMRQEWASFSEALETERVTAAAVVGEERRLCEERLTSALTEASLQHKRSLVEAVQEEREKKKELYKSSLDVAKSDVQQYLAQQRQDAQSLHARQLSSLDLFLQSARKQLDLLIDSSHPPT